MAEHVLTLILDLNAAALMDGMEQHVKMILMNVKAALVEIMDTVQTLWEDFTAIVQKDGEETLVKWMSSIRKLRLLCSKRRGSEITFF